MDWSRNESRPDDITALPRMVVSAGPKKGTYRENLNRDGTDIVIEKFDEETKSWVLTGYKPSNETLREKEAAGARAVAHRGEERIKRETAGKVVDILVNTAGSGGMPKEEIDRLLDEELTRNAVIGPRDRAMVEDEMIMRGIDPESLKLLGSLSRRQFEALQKRNPDRLQQITMLLKERRIRIVED